MRWMHLQLRAPLMAFGGVAIDAYGVIRDFPAQSMLAGLFASALGWTRGMRSEHQSLQDNLTFGALHELPLNRLTDYQIAQLYQDDQSWSTRGAPLGRKRSKSYGRTDARGPWQHSQRWRDYGVDLRVSLVVRVGSGPGLPTLDELAAALNRPARPLFLGRKSCPPAAPLFRGWVDAPDARAALCQVAPEGATNLRAIWPAAEGTEGATRTFDVTDRRDWISGLHGGDRQVCEGRLSAAEDGA